MLKAHVDIEVLVDALNKFYTNPVNMPRDFIDLVNKNSHLVWYGEPSEDDYRLLSQMLAGREESLIRMESKASCINAEVNTSNPFQLFFASQNNFSEEIRSNFFSASLFDYEEKFNKLSLDSHIRVGDPDSERLLKNWSDLSPEIFVSDVILVDPFILNTDKVVELETNLYDILRRFSSKYVLKSFLIFTRHQKQDFENKEINRIDILNKCREILGQKTIVGIVHFERGLEEHDRYLFMNYQFINSGNSFSSVFDGYGKPRNTNSSSIRIHSLIKPVNYQHMVDVLSRIKKSLDALHDKKEKLKYISSCLFACVRQGI